MMCDNLRTSIERSKGLHHLLSVEDERATVFCIYCEEKISLGLVRLGMTNFKLHMSTARHSAKMADYHGMESVENTAATAALSELDQKVYIIKKDGVITCRPCGKSFGKSNSSKLLLSNIKQHGSTPQHKKECNLKKNIRRVDEFFGQPISKKQKEQNL
eukprot:Seg4447.6 transcript_id=Seg4447.6/GoldUCD/mRNA.D3Y31 product="hypothetical protein" protein_id=Seg4447.6/GoldUCD/D3Y31